MTVFSSIIKVQKNLAMSNASSRNNDDNIIIKRSVKKAKQTLNVIKHKVLIHGVVREMEQNLRTYYQIHDNSISCIIPLELTRMIISFFPSYKIYGIGWNTKGQLGYGHAQRLPEYVELLSFAAVCSDAKNISVGNKRFMVQNSGNEVYCTGFNHRGQLGIGIVSDTVNTFSPMVTTINNLSSLQEVDFISNGIASNHTFIKSLTDNKIYGFGTNMYSQLGFKSDTKENEPFPVHIPEIHFTDDSIIDIECGLSHTLFLSSSGSVYSSGSNQYGQCGVENANKVNYPTLINFDTKSKITTIKCGACFSICMNIHNQLIAFGQNEFGQLGGGVVRRPGLISFFEDKKINVAKISCGYGYTVCIDDNGKCYVWGCNYSHQLGIDGSIIRDVRILEIERLIDISCGSEHTLFLSKTNNIYICGQNYGMKTSKQIFSYPTKIPKDEIGADDNMPITKVIAGTESSLIILEWTNETGKM